MSAEQMRKGAAYCSSAHENLYETLSRLGAVPQARGDVRDIPPDEPEAPEPSSRGGKTCRLCGKTLPFLVRLRGGQFCSSYHEREYQEKEAAVALTRVREYQRRGGSSGLQAEPGTVRVRNRGGAAPLTPMRVPAPAPAMNWHGGAAGFELPGPAAPVRLGPGRPQPLEAPLWGGVARVESGGSLALTGAIWGFAQQDVALAGAPRVGERLWRYEQAPLGGDWLTRCEQTAASVEAAWVALGGEPLLPQSALSETENSVAPPRLVEPLPERAAGPGWAFENQARFLSQDPAPADLAATDGPEAGWAAHCGPPRPVDALPARAGHAAWAAGDQGQRWRLNDDRGIWCDLDIAEWSASMARLSALTQPHPIALARIGHSVWERSQPAALMGSTIATAHPPGGVFAAGFACAPALRIEFEAPRQSHCGWPAASAAIYRTTEPERLWPAPIAAPPRPAVRRAPLLPLGSTARCDGEVLSSGAQQAWTNGPAGEVTLAAQSAAARRPGSRPGTLGWQCAAVPAAIRPLVWNAPAAAAWASDAGTMAWITARVDTSPAAPYGPPPRRIPFMDADEPAAAWADATPVAAWLGESRPVAQPASAAPAAPRCRIACRQMPIEAVPRRMLASNWVLKDARQRLRLPALRMQWPPDRRIGPAER